MNGAQDLGGMMGFGPVVAEKDEPVFHGRWESRVLANVVATQALGWWSGDRSRFARESLNPGFYLTHSYYEIWLAALEKLVIAKGAASAYVLGETKDAWDRAARATPHGKPIVLGAEKTA